MNIGNDSKKETVSIKNKEIDKKDKNEIVVHDLSISTLDGKELIKNLSFSLTSGTKLAIIGMEGVGKTTLLKAMAGEQLDDFIVTGTITRGNVGYLSQDLDKEWFNSTVSEFFLKDSPDSEIPLERWNDCVKIGATLATLGLQSSLIESDQLISSFSGGEKVRIRLAKVLFQSPDILLFDEPTNHLDIKTIKFLEQFILKSKLPIAFVSHDETLIRNVSNSILHFHYIPHKNQTIISFSGLTYDEFLTLQRNEVDRSHQLLGQQRRETKSLKKQYAEMSSKSSSRDRKKDPTQKTDMMSKNREAKGSTSAKNKLSQLKDKIDSTEKIETKELETAIKLDLSADSIVPSGKSIINLKLDNLMINEKELAKDVTLNITGPEKVVIIGGNGSGKTTLMRHLYDLMKDRSDLRVAYIPQFNADVIKDDHLTAIEYLQTFSNDRTLPYTILARMNFTRDEMTHRISELSCGQRSKLLLSSVVLSGANVILLDEPTTNMSPLSNPAIRESLRSFPGSIIAISHDRAFISEVATVIYELDKTGLKVKSKDEVV